MSRIRWAPAYRVISSRYPTVSVYDRIVRTADFEAILEIEALTNPRIREEAGDYRKIRAQDRVSGPGSTPVMASFAYSGYSRFTDGTFGVYYAAREEATALAESLYHTERFMRATREPSIDLDKRVYAAAITGSYDDIRALSTRARVYDKNSYVHSQAYSRKRYEANGVDGIVYRSVRRTGGECVAVYRPRLVTKCRLAKYVQFRWDGERIAAAAEITAIRP
ncbi:MAG: RES family NAD+ phosphorylase [Candidatus Baltobacteraceae bacterium]